MSVGIAAGRAELEETADESRRAIETLGRSAVTAVLDRDDPPPRITVTTSGLRFEHEVLSMTAIEVIGRGHQSVSASSPDFSISTSVLWRGRWASR